MNKNVSFEFKEFDLNNLCKHPSIAIIGNRYSNRNWICKSILKHLNYPSGLIISPNEKYQDSKFYSNFFPDSYIHYDYNPDVIDKLLYRQQIMFEEKKNNPDIITDGFVIMEDCLNIKGTWTKDAGVMDLLYNSRHYHLMYIFSMQTPLGITPELRSNFDYIFLLASNIESDKMRMYNHYAGMIPDYNIFNKVFTNLTSDSDAMVIVNRSSKILDKIFWYKVSNNIDYYFDNNYKQTVNTNEFDFYLKNN